MRQVASGTCLPPLGAFLAVMQAISLTAFSLEALLAGRMLVASDSMVVRPRFLHCCGFPEVFVWLSKETVIVSTLYILEAMKPLELSNKPPST